MFIAIDGEGFTNKQGEHIYNLIAASTGEYLLDETGLGLRTKEVFNWLFDLKAKYPEAVFVSFYFSYDVNMIIRNAKRYVRILAKNGYVHLDDKEKTYVTCKAEYIPAKFFRLSRGYRKGILGVDFRYIRTDDITVWDVWGFFQSKFLSGMKSYNVGTPEELEIIRSMKLGRSDFGEVPIDDIIKYNQIECKLLVQAMDKLETSLEIAGLKLVRWDGAGAAAMAMMRKYKTIEHKGRPTKDSPHELAVMSAYFGGRIQAIQLGEFNTCFGHDLISAYPSTLQYLPSLKGMIEVIIDDYDTGDYNRENDCIIWHVRWNLPSATKVCPFPFRLEDGSITYPYRGEGFYWSCEVRSALRYYASYITVMEGYEFKIEDDTLPFSFIPIEYEKRRQFKAEGNHAEKAIKLCLNSLYGKCAQGRGWNNSIPSSQCYIWAGMTTAGTRSKVFELAMQNEDSVIAFSTDGVFSTQQLTEEISGLGGWEVNEYRCMFNLKSGFYRGRMKNGKTVRHVRGFGLKEIRWASLVRTWRQWGILGDYKTTTRRFIGMKAAGQSLKNWRQWVDSDKTLSMMPTQGDAVCINEGEGMNTNPEIANTILKKIWKPRVGRGLQYHIYGQSREGEISKCYNPELITEDGIDYRTKDETNKEGMLAG